MLVRVSTVRRSLRYGDESIKQRRLRHIEQLLLIWVNVRKHIIIPNAGLAGLPEVSRRAPSRREFDVLPVSVFFVLFGIASVNSSRVSSR